MKTKVIKFETLEDLLTKLFAFIDEDMKCPSNEENKVNLGYFIEEIARKKGWRPERVAGWLNGIAELSPAAAFSILIREIAVWLDKKYEDHIENSEKIYIISTLDGRIHEACKGHIKNYRNFAAFRSVEDAKVACNILREELKEMFKGCGK